MNSIKYHNTTMLFNAILIATIASFVAAQSTDGVCTLSLPRYSGGWYELATSDFVANTLERDCICSAAYYTLNSTNSDNLDVTNSCIRKSDGSYYSVTGHAYPSDKGQPQGNLRVVIDQPSPPITSEGKENSANYIAMRLWSDDSEDDRYSLVGSNYTNAWWLLSRSPNWNGTIWNSALHLLEAYDYNVTNWRKTEQTCLFLGTHGNNLLPPSGTVD